MVVFLFILKVYGMMGRSDIGCFGVIESTRLGGGS